MPAAGAMPAGAMPAAMPAVMPAAGAAASDVNIDGESPIRVWPFTSMDWPIGAGPELFPYSSRTFVFLLVFLLFSGNLGRAFFPMAFYLLMEPNLMKDPAYRKFCGDSDEAIGTSDDSGGPYSTGYRNHEVANDWVMLSSQERSHGERGGTKLLAAAAPPAGGAAAAAAPGAAAHFVGVNPLYGFRMASTRNAAADATAHATDAHGDEDLLGGGAAARPRSSATLDASRLMLLSLVMLDAGGNASNLTNSSSGGSGSGGGLGSMLIAPLGRRTHGDTRPAVGANLTGTGGRGAFNLSAAEPDGRYLRRALGCRAV